MRYSRPVRLVFGIIILILFGWYQVRWMTNSVMSNEVGNVQKKPATAAAASTPAPEAAVTEAAPAAAAFRANDPVWVKQSSTLRPSEIRRIACRLYFWSRKKPVFWLFSTSTV